MDEAAGLKDESRHSLFGVVWRAYPAKRLTLQLLNPTSLIYLCYDRSRRAQ